MKIVVFVIATSLTFHAAAHEGHGEGGWFAHEIEHGLFFLALTLIAAALGRQIIGKFIKKRYP